MNLLAATAGGLYLLERRTAERLTGGGVTSLAVDGDTVWAVTDNTTLVRGDSHGSFALVCQHDRALRCLLPRGRELIVGTAEAGLAGLQGDRLVTIDGFASAPGRGDWYTPWGGPPDTRSLALGPEGTIYANVHVGGILRSTDDGAAWTPTMDIDADVHEVTVAGDLVLAAAAGGLAVSDDRGETWQWRTEGLHARYARAVVAADGHVLVSVSQGPGGVRSALYRGPLGVDGPLTRCRQGLPEWFEDNVDTGCLVAKGQSVAAADGGTVYHCENGGKTWGLLAEDLPVVHHLAPKP